MTTKRDKQNFGNQFSSWVTVSNKGQIAIPIGIRKQLNINTGDRMLVIVRKDKDGINLIKSEVLNKTFDEFSK
jgi:AbrB family looped-hinge helix DNA binding protein